MSTDKIKGDQKPTISPTDHDQNVGQRGGIESDSEPMRRQQSGAPNSGQPLTGNKNQGDDLEPIIPGKDRPTRDDGDNDDEGELK